MATRLSWGHKYIITFLKGQEVENGRVFERLLHKVRLRGRQQTVEVRDGLALSPMGI